MTDQNDDRTASLFTAQDLGEQLAHAVRWDIQAITVAFLAALTDANAHTLRARIESVLTTEGL